MFKGNLVVNPDLWPLHCGPIPIKAGTSISMSDVSVSQKFLNKGGGWGGRVRAVALLHFSKPPNQDFK